MGYIGSPNCFYSTYTLEVKLYMQLQFCLLSSQYFPTKHLFLKLIFDFCMDFHWWSVNELYILEMGWTSFQYSAVFVAQCCYREHNCPATHRCVNYMHIGAVLCEQKWRENVPKVTKVTENPSQKVVTSLHLLCP